MRRSVAPRASFAVLAFVTAFGCNDKPGGFGMDNQGQLPNIKIEMPEVPSFTGGSIPLAYPDQSQSVLGLRRRMEKFLGQDVKVTGYVIYNYVCPPEIKKCKGLQCKNCEKPHFYLGDTADQKCDDANPGKCMIVSDYLNPGDKAIPGEPGADTGAYDVAKITGQQVIVDAMYDKSSGAGFKSSDGVLSLKLLTLPNGTPVPKAPVISVGANF